MSSVWRHPLAQKIGIDKAVAYTVLSRGFQASGSVVSLLLIARYLGKVEQGYYYTFASVLALQVFFELGFNGIVVQYAAHEAAHVRSYSSAGTEAEKIALSRLSGLLRFCIRWFSCLSVALLALLLVGGVMFFQKYGVEVRADWFGPWCLLTVATSLMFILQPILCFQEGLGYVKEVARVRLIQQVASMTAMWVTICLGGKLYCAGIACVSSLMVTAGLLCFSKHSRTLLQIWAKLDRWRISYRTEILPYQWKIALSWVSGYFIFQLFNPVLFATEGAIVAGQMGMSLAILNGVLNTTISWISTKVPSLSKHIARQEYAQSDLLFHRISRQALIVNAMGLVGVIGIVAIAAILKVSIAERFLPVELVALLGGATFLSQMVFGWATYLRCHKREPYLFPSMVAAILTGTSTVVCGNLFGVNGVVIGYASLSVLILPWNLSIFISTRAKWHVQ